MDKKQALLIIYQQLALVRPQNDLTGAPGSAKIPPIIMKEQALLHGFDSFMPNFVWWAGLSA
ncbi:MAG: hypothetical protein ACYDH0_01165 [Candidatus Aminicenantales bacterium]